MPSFCVANSQQAMNHTVSGVGVRSKIVPAVTDVAAPARRAPEPPVVQPPATKLSAVRAHEPARPAQPLQVVQTISVGAKPGQKLAHRPPVVHPGYRSSDHAVDRSALQVRSSGYPHHEISLSRPADRESKAGQQAGPGPPGQIRPPAEDAHRWNYPQARRGAAFLLLGTPPPGT